MSAKQNRWSAAVTCGSNALDLSPEIFRLKNPGQIALSLKRSAENSRRRKGTPFQPAMSMLNFYINRAGAGLSARRKNFLTQAKEKLREAFHKNKTMHQVTGKK